MTEEKYNDYIQAVLKECPDASESEIHEAFTKYEEEFYIPPQDALRSVIRRFSSGTSQPKQSTPLAQKETKKVALLSELNADDKDIEIEVVVVTHNVREQSIRGEERQIAFGMIEDQPWDEKGQKNRWDFKDWGPHQNLTAGSIVRIEGASVNEYNGKMSLNINQSSRIVVLQEGASVQTPSQDPIDINDVPSEGYICVVGRVLASRPDQIHRKDGSGSIDVVRGRIADNTGSIGFLSWEPFEHEVGTLLKIDGAQVRSFRDNPELNFGRTTRVEVFHDASFADVASLSESSSQSICDFRDGSRDVDTTVQIVEWQKRTFERDGVEKFLWSGQAVDPSGQCRISAWEPLPFETSDLPVTVKLTGVRIRAWQGVPDITIDRIDQVEIIESPPWGKDIDPSTHVVNVGLAELATGSSRVGIQSSGFVVSVRDDSGFIKRCTECNRVLRDGVCNEHGSNNGLSDIRFRLVVDDEGHSISVLLNKSGALGVMDMDEGIFSTAVEEHGDIGFVQRVRERLLGKKVQFSGRSIADAQGVLVLSEMMNFVHQDTQLHASELRTQWGWG